MTASPNFRHYKISIMKLWLTIIVFSLVVFSELSHADPFDTRSIARATYTITSEDIRRSAVTNIPDILRMAPGLTVARADSHSWVVSTAGFGNLQSKKLLVLLDGEIINNATFGGVDWDTLDTVLEDIDRIEVTRGPVILPSGINASSGLVNIVTKHSRDTQLGLLSGATGSEQQLLGTLRYGNALGEGTTYRLFGKYTDRDTTNSVEDMQAFDAWRGSYGGFRLDSAIDEDDSLEINGRGYYVGENTTIDTFEENGFASEGDRAYLNGGAITALWKHNISDTSGLEFRSSYDYSDRAEPILDLQSHQANFELTHHFSPLTDHDLLWGTGYQFTHDNLDDSAIASIESETRNIDLFTWLIQDTIVLVPDTLTAVISSGFERNDFTGFEYLPSGRLSYDADIRNNVWLAVSRSVTRPDRAQDDILFHDSQCQSGVITGCPTVDRPDLPRTFEPNRSLDAESAVTYELGYFRELSSTANITLSSFMSDYDQIIVPTEKEDSFVLENSAEGEIYGGELSVDWRISDTWRVAGYYTYSESDTPYDSASQNTGNTVGHGFPENQFSIRSAIDLPNDLELDTILRYVDSFTLPEGGTDEYFNLDLKLAWQADSNLEIAMIAQNILREDTFETIQTYGNTTLSENERSVFFKFTWLFE